MIDNPLNYPLSSQTLLPDLLQRHPEARPVFDRYGLRGCGGPLGPRESIQFFSRTHGVEESQLLNEIREAISAAARGVETKVEAATAADTIYRRFFMGGIATILTAGAVWGAWLLWQIGVAGKFTGISVNHINAHGHAQIFGWVGLFIMGFAAQAFPRLWHTSLAAPRLAVSVFFMMLAGIVLRTSGMTAPDAGWAMTAAMSGGALEILGIAIFGGLIVATFLKSEARLEPYVAFVLAGIVFFLIQAVFSVWHMWAVMSATTQEALIAQVATWQAPLRDLQIHGLALFMIVGVNLRMLPAFYELKPVPPRRAWSAFGVLLAAVVGEVVLFLAYRVTGIHILAAFLLLPWLMLTLGCIMVAGPWKLWRPLTTPDGAPDRSAKFIRAAWGWLTVSLAMLLLLPAYQATSGIPFSHAYYGAIRHAITVGFISLMIMGFAAKVVPTLSGLDPKDLSLLRAPFWLINIGCFLRVSTQTLTDWHPDLFAVIGVSGMLEVAGLAIWGIHLARIMVLSRQDEREDFDAGSAPETIQGDHTPAQVLAWFPETEPVFVTHNFGLVRNPVLRRTVARRVTLSQATALRQQDLEPFLDDLNGVAHPAEPNEHKVSASDIPA